MKQTSRILKVSLNMLPLSDNSIVLEDKLILDDNFNIDNIPLTNETLYRKGVNGEIGSGEPFKQQFIIIMFCRQGKMTLVANSEECEISGGMVAVFFLGNILERIRVSEDFRLAVLAFPADMFFTDNKCTSLGIIRENMLHPLIFPINAKQTRMCYKFYKTLRGILQTEPFIFKKDAIEGYLQIMAAHLAQWITEQQNGLLSKKTGRNEAMFHQFLLDVQVHSAKEKRIGFYAKKYNITPKYFAKIIYETSGKTAGEWIKDYVIMEAKSMLRTGIYTVQQVSLALNFPNPSFFGKYFKSAVGMSPRRFMLKEEK